MRNNPTNQHDVPSTYLKKFAISSEKEKIVALLRIHHEKKIEEKSVDSDFFKNKNLYTINNENPFVVEETFRDFIEPRYPEIHKEISEEINLSESVKSNLVLWLWFSKYRNVQLRRAIEQQLNFLNSSGKKYNLADYPKNLSEEDFEIFRDSYAKELHLKTMFNEDLIKKFTLGMASKHWIILKSSEMNKFITNDNPGFSVNFIDGKPDFNSINVQFATNHSATNYYPISPNYCLMISPFWKGTSLNLNFWNLRIRYVETNENHIDFINMATFLQLRKYCVANHESHLKKYLGVEHLAHKDFSNSPYFPISGVVMREGHDFKKRN